MTILKYSGGGTTAPPTPWMGSPMKAAICPLVSYLMSVFGVAGAFEVAGGVGEAEGAAVAVAGGGEFIVGGGVGFEFPGGVGGDAHGGGGAAVVAVAERDDVGVAGEFAGGEECHFVGFGSRSW